MQRHRHFAQRSTFGGLPHFTAPHLPPELLSPADMRRMGQSSGAQAGIRNFCEFSRLYSASLSAPLPLSPPVPAAGQTRQHASCQGAQQQDAAPTGPGHLLPAQQPDPCQDNTKESRAGAGRRHPSPCGDRYTPQAPGHGRAEAAT